jgi:hypothetical protein
MPIFYPLAENLVPKLKAIYHDVYKQKQVGEWIYWSFLIDYAKTELDKCDIKKTPHPYRDAGV